MTAKYMFISAYQDSDKAKLFDQCHCPMDGIMCSYSFVNP